MASSKTLRDRLNRAAAGAVRLADTAAATKPRQAGPLLRIEAGGRLRIDTIALHALNLANRHALSQRAPKRLRAVDASFKRVATAIAELEAALKEQDELAEEVNSDVLDEVDESVKDPASREYLKAKKELRAKHPDWADFKVADAAMKLAADRMKGGSK